MLCEAFVACGLHTLSAKWCPLTDLSCVGRLTSLRNLALNATHIADVAALSLLVSLTSLDISGTR